MLISFIEIRQRWKIIHEETLQGLTKLITEFVETMNESIEPIAINLKPIF